MLRLQREGHCRATKIGHCRATKIGHHRATTLVEVLVAIAIIAFVLLPFIFITLLSLRTARQADIQIASYQAAQRELEELRTLSFDNLVPGTQANFALPACVVNNYSNFSLQGTYRIEATAVASVRQISVEVKWKNYIASQSSDNSNTWSQVRVASLIAKP